MPQDVDFTAKLNAGTVEWTSPDGNPAKHHRMNVAKGADPEEIEIRIKADQSAKDLKLRINCSAPFHVSEDTSKCPSAGIETDQIQVLACSADRVIVRHLNTGPGRELRYQVNVIDKDGNEHPCDPIIQNGGGGPGTSFI